MYYSKTNCRFKMNERMVQFRVDGTEMISYASMKVRCEFVKGDNVKFLSGIELTLCF
jgi:hypothetical protein